MHNDIYNEIYEWLLCAAGERLRAVSGTTGVTMRTPEGIKTSCSHT